MIENTHSEIKPGIKPYFDPEISPNGEIAPTNSNANIKNRIDRNINKTKIDYLRQDLSWIEHLSKTFHSNSFHRGPVRRSARVTVLWSMTAAMIDGLVLFAGACFLLLSFCVAFHLNSKQIILDIKQLEHFAQQLLSLSVSHQSWIDVQENPLSGFFMLMPTMIFFYLSFTRIYLGFSLGEWACYLRMGSVNQRSNPQYSWWVVRRTLLICFSGFVFLPIMSAILGQDLAGFISGLCITNKPPTA